MFICSQGMSEDCAKGINLDFPEEAGLSLLGWDAFTCLQTRNILNCCQFLITLITPERCFPWKHKFSHHFTDSKIELLSRTEEIHGAGQVTYLNLSFFICNVRLTLFTGLVTVSINKIMLLGVYHSAQT